MRIRLIASGAVIALVAAACGGSEHNEKSLPGTTASAPTATGGPSSQLQVGDALTGNGSDLENPSSPDTRQIDPEQACRTFLETPAGQCDIVMMAGGNALWTVEAMRSTPSGERFWSVRVRSRSTAMPDGGWDVALQVPQDDALYANVAVRAHDVTGDGRPELLIGYRFGGTGQFETYDVVTYEQGKPLAVAAHRQGLHKGSVALEGTTIVDYSADEQSPECCPTKARRTAIAFNGGEFRVTEAGDVPIDQQPPDLFG
jgi:hypothetical protein